MEEQNRRVMEEQNRLYRLNSVTHVTGSIAEEAKKSKPHFGLTIMGLSNYPCAAEGVIPLIVMNTVMSVALLKNMFRSVLQAVGGTTSSTITNDGIYYYPSSYSSMFQDTTTCASSSCSRPRRVSITHYKSLCRNNDKSVMVECCVCLTGFEANQEVSELPCKHFFHTSCLDKWFDNKHTTCPLCRSFS